MTHTQLEALLKRETELQEMLREATAARQVEQTRLKEVEEAAKRKLEMEQPVRVEVTMLTGGSLLLESNYRPDVVEYLKAVPGRSFKGYTEGAYADRKGKNLIPVIEWLRTEVGLVGLGNLTISWADGVKEELEWFTNAPPWEIDFHQSQKFFIAKMGPRQEHLYLFQDIPGSNLDYGAKSWKLPRSEGWRISKKLEGIEGVVYSEEAKEVIFEQVEGRAKLDVIAKKEDSDFITELRGNEFYPFQKVGVEFIHAAGGRVLLGDGTGLGKTWQALGYSERMRSEDPDFQTVIVAKAANVPNWKREVLRLTGEEVLFCKSGKVDFFTHLQPITERKVPYVLISYDTLASYQEVEVEEEDEYDPSYEPGPPVEQAKQKLYPWVGVFQASKPDLLVMDESHMAKNPETYRFKALRQLVDVPHKIPMTASPVLNRTEELWTSLHMIDPKMFPSYIHFVNTYTWNGKRPKNVEQLHELLRPMFLRRRKKDVLKDLPPINRIERFHELSERAQFLYQKILKGLYESLAEFDPRGIGGEEMSVMTILAQITRLKQVCAADTIDYTVDLAQEIIDEASDNGNGEKVLIFSHFKGSAYNIARKLGHEAVCTVKRTDTGFHSLTAEKRDELFEGARSDPAIKYIVTTEAAKEGHNLEFCHWVVFNDLFWTPEGHSQCEGRAYGRLSNPHPIDSFYVIADVQVVKWIMELLRVKMSIIEEAVEGIEGSREGDESIVVDLIRKMKSEMYSR